MAHIDLAQYQPNAWADIRDGSLYGLNAAMLAAVTAEGLDPETLTKAPKEATMRGSLAVNLALIQHQVRQWHVLDDDGQELPAPRTVTATQLAWCDEALLDAILAAIQTARGVGDALVDDPKASLTASTGS